MKLLEVVRDANFACIGGKMKAKPQISLLSAKYRLSIELPIATLSPLWFNTLLVLTRPGFNTLVVLPRPEPIVPKKLPNIPFKIS